MRDGHYAENPATVLVRHALKGEAEVPIVRRSTRWKLLTAAGVAVVMGLGVALTTPGFAMGEDPTANPPQIIPKPVSMTVGSGQFTVTQHTRIIARGDAEWRAVGADDEQRVAVLCHEQGQRVAEVRLGR